MSNTFFAQDGSWGDATGMVIIDTRGWTSEDFDDVDNANDDERQDVALAISDRYAQEEGAALNTYSYCGECGGAVDTDPDDPDGPLFVCECEEASK